MAGVGVQSEIDVNSSPVIGMPGRMASPSTWSWVWFVLAMLIIVGFHIKMFGRAIPPSANFP